MTRIGLVLAVEVFDEFGYPFNRASIPDHPSRSSSICAYRGARLSLNRLTQGLPGPDMSLASHQFRFVVSDVLIKDRH